MKTGKVILSVLLAAAAGVTAGILFAPEKGSRTRRRIREQGEDCLLDMKEEYKRSIDNLQRKADAIYQDVEHKISGAFADKGKQQPEI